MSLATQTTAAVSLEGVTKSFVHGGRRTVVLDGIDLTVGRGEFVSLLGASGCGKSTLLGMVAGLDTPTSGTLLVGGGQPALMFQEPALLPWLTAGGNVDLALRLRGIPPRERPEQVMELLRLVRLEHLADRRPHQLSGGQRQRVAMARSIAQGSELLLMDEPFAALDAITRDLLHAELIELWQERGIAVLFVTHNVREAVRLGERVVLLSSRPGRVVREWRVHQTQPRAIEDPEVGHLATEITAVLREQITRHAHH
ncbi:ABC transporter ATP-binding protein [Actinomycetota bacterium]|nr:ABC transporter ATP-binding protein [Micrococcales bacterium]